MDKRDKWTLETTATMVERSGVSLERISYHGWPECLRLFNGRVEAVIVPAISRVMHFGQVDEPEEAFWQNRALDGQQPPSAPKEWFNFGGDKCWPAPQSSWPERGGRSWPPPQAFDALPADAAAIEGGVVLTSPIDPHYGIQMVRTVKLDTIRLVMSIAVEFRKLEGPPVQAGIWTVTQLREPEAILLWEPEVTRFPRGYLSLLGARPTDLSRRGRLLSLRRNPSIFTKIGSEARSIAWVGKSSVLRIDAKMVPGEYPDGGCVTEVYTNPDPLKYVELETMGPLENISIGGRIGRTTLYTVMPRRTAVVESEAENIFD
ncbi:MAG: hypothetical protein WAN35_17815 [Terracidiphilus sp.]